MEALRRVLNSRKRQLLSLDNVVGVGAGHKSVRGESTGKKAIVVFVEKKLPVDALRRGHLVPTSMNGIDTDVIETGKFSLLARTDRLRPAQPGISIGHRDVTAGTFGAVVKDNATGEQLILSNNHVLANATNGRDGRSAIGDPILQPGKYDHGTLETDVIGELLRFVPINSMVNDVQCPIAQGFARGITALLNLIVGDYSVRLQREGWEENIVDCAVAKPLKSATIATSILELGEISGFSEAAIGKTVRKSGRTSGLTEGKVSATDVTINVNMGNGSVALFGDQVMTDMPSKPGDSGSIVLNEENQAVGLLFAGSDNLTLFNKFSNIMKLLEVNITE